MDQNERQQDEKLTLEQGKQINVVLNTPGTEEDSIDLGRVFHNMKIKRRVFAWVLVLCLVAGVCAPLVLYQFSRPMLTVASVVTLNYNVPMTYSTNSRGVTSLVPTTLKAIEDNPTMVVVWQPVTSLTAPDGEDLNLDEISSSYVLAQAMKGLELSQPVTAANIRANITVERMLTEESSQAQELLSKMSTDKSNNMYEQLANTQLVYDNKFVVRLKNGFGDEESNVKLELENSELQLLLDRILAAYNDYLVKTYADLELPDDEFSVINTARLDIPESLDLIRTALNNLYDYCDGLNPEVKEYRSGADGRNLLDWMETIKTQREVSVDYLYSDVYANSIVRNRATTLTSYRYQLRTAETDLETVNENIAANRDILKDYKNDEIYVSMQESDAAMTTKAATAYYNSLTLQQAENYAQVVKLETKIADLNSRIATLEASASTAAEQSVEDSEAALEKVLANCKNIYEGITAHLEALMDSAFYTQYAEHTMPQGKVDNFLVASWKKMLIFGAVGAVLACGIWFIAALAPEFRRNRKDDEEDGKTGKDLNTGKEAAEA